MSKKAGQLSLQRAAFTNVLGPHPRGVEAFKRLVAHCDIVVENYTARVMRGWGLDYEHLKELNPRLIMVSNTGYGHGGPWESVPVQGTALEATTGIPNFSGYRDGRPWTIGQSYPDFVSMWHGLFCVMAALRQRQETGEGQWIDLGMYAANVAMQGEAMLDFAANGRKGARERLESFWSQISAEGALAPDALLASTENV